MMYIYLMIFTIVLILCLVIFKIFFGRSFLTKHKYIRLEKYTKDRTLYVTYHKKNKFNSDKALLINPTHVFTYNGYTSIITSDVAAESINPLDFDSKYNVADFKSAMKSNLILQTFNGLKVEKFDTIKFLLILSVIQLIAIVYLVYTLTKGG